MFGDFKVLIMRKILLLCLVLSVFSCRQKEQVNTSEVVPANSNPLNFSESLGRSYAIALIGDRLVVRDDQAETKLTVLNLKDDSPPIYTGHIGQGPGELTTPGPMIMEAEHFLIYDAAKSKLLSFHLDSLAVESYIPQKVLSIKEAGLIDIKKISKDTFLAIGVFPENRFLLINKHGEIIRKSGTYPIPLADNVPEYVRGIACQSMLATNVEKNIAATAMRYGENIQFHAFNLDDSSTKLELLNEHSVFLPEYSTKDYNGSPNFSPNEKTKWGYLSLSSNENFVYALYSGKPQVSGTKFYQGDQIHVFDWSGNRLKTIKLDKEAISIASNQSLLYALYEGNNGYEIAEYKL